MNTPEPSRNENYLNKAGMFVVLFTLLIGCVLAYWSLYPYKTIEYETPIEILNSPVKAGDTIFFRLKWCKYVDSPTRLSKMFVNDITISLEETVATNKKGCGEAIVPLQIPTFFDSGTYYLKVMATNKVNPIREINVYYQTEKFEVINDG